MSPLFRKSVSIERIFAALLIILPLQAVLVGVVGSFVREPWPSITMPSFHKVYSVNEGVRMRRPRIFLLTPDFQTLEVKTTDFFEGIPATHQKAVYRSLFEPEGYHSPDEETKKWLEQHAKRMLPGKTLTGISVVWEDITVQKVENRITARTAKSDSLVIHFGPQIGDSANTE